jgi:hypothetical protein
MERRLVELAMRGDEEAFDLLVGQIGDGLHYILDVEGIRVVVTVAWMPASPAADVAELEGMLESLTIQPR